MISWFFFKIHIILNFETLLKSRIIFKNQKHKRQKNETKEQGAFFHHETHWPAQKGVRRSEGRFDNVAYLENDISAEYMIQMG